MIAFDLLLEADETRRRLGHRWRSNLGHTERGKRERTGAMASGHSCKPRKRENENPKSPKRAEAEGEKMA